MSETAFDVIWLHTSLPSGTQRSFGTPGVPVQGRHIHNMRMRDRTLTSPETKEPNLCLCAFQEQAWLLKKTVLQTRQHNELLEEDLLRQLDVVDEKACRAVLPQRFKKQQSCFEHVSFRHEATAKTDTRAAKRRAVCDFMKWDGGIQKNVASFWHVAGKWP